MVFVNDANPNAPQGWQHELHEAAQQVQADHGLNATQMADIQDELQVPVDAADLPDDGWDAWPVENQDQNQVVKTKIKSRNRNLLLLISLGPVLHISGLMAQILF